jgi:ABC-type uncharacterized transport system ATPase subunit
VIRGGKLVAEGTPASLRARAGKPTVTIHGSGFDGVIPMLRDLAKVLQVDVVDGRLTIDFDEDIPVAPIIRLLVDSGAAVEEVHKRGASLEDAFLALLSEPDGVQPEVAG